MSSPVSLMSSPITTAGWTFLIALACDLHTWRRFGAWNLAAMYRIISLGSTFILGLSLATSVLNVIERESSALTNSFVVIGLGMKLVSLTIVLKESIPPDAVDGRDLPVVGGPTSAPYN